ncbi:MAG TPA: aminotransferase class V-fold PLP-dependent enzyme [Planctomycetes bacterium]|nr:aminotransferase class V-fold PLP-dependent enzyme [Planctomycetota bacterium]
MSPFDPMESLASMRHEFGEHGGVNMSIETSTTFTVLDAEVMPEIFSGQRSPEQGGCYLYGRHFNPTVYVLGRELAALEGAEAGYATASGMGAVMGSVLQHCTHGDHIVASKTLYGGTFALLKEFLPKRCGIRTTFVDVGDLEEVSSAIEERTRVLYLESVANPTLTVADIPALANVAHDRGIQLVVDNTFSPLILSPILLGADVVVHSLTKFINGASDLIGGAICGRKSFITELMDLHEGCLMLLGPTMDPKRAFEVSMRIPHLGLRIKEHSRRALVFAERLSELGLDVTYPGLVDHPQHELMSRLMNREYGFGGLLCLDVHEAAKADALMETLQNRDRFGYMAVSLGYHHTLISRPAASTSSELTEEEQRAAGIPPGLIRISVGYTGSMEQRWQQLEDALRVTGLIA